LLIFMTHLLSLQMEVIFGTEPIHRWKSIDAKYCITLQLSLLVSKTMSICKGHIPFEENREYEQKANIYVIASNGFCLDVQSDDYSQDKILTEDEIAMEVHSSHCKRGVTKGQKKAMYLVKTALKKRKTGCHS